MQDNVTLNSAEFLPFHSLSLPRSGSNFWHLSSSVSVKFPEGLAEFVKFLPSDICSRVPLQFCLAGDLRTAAALFQLLGERTQAVRFSDCSYPQRFTMSVMAQNAPVYFLNMVRGETSLQSRCVEGAAEPGCFIPWFIKSS